MNRRVLGILVLVVIFLLPLVVVISILVMRERARVNTPLTFERRLELLREKSVTLGHLENNEYEKALPGLETIAREVPDDPLGHRNLALALFKPSPTGIDSTLASQETERLARLLGTVERLLQVDGQSLASRYLAGRVYAKQAELLRVTNPAKSAEWVTKSKKEFAEAARLSPQDPGPMFEIYALEKVYGDAERLPEEGLKALRAAHARVPENLACLVELLDQLMSRKDPERLVVIEQILRLLPGDIDTLQEGAQPRRGFQKIATLLKHKPDEVPVDVFGELNGVRNQLDKFFGFYKRDQGRLRPHPLEFVAEDFQPKFYEALPPEAAEPAIDVGFVPLAPPVGANTPGAPTNVVAVVRDDLTCNNGHATVVLRRLQGKVRIETLEGTVQLPPLEVEGGFGAFQLADLDLDISAAPKDAHDRQNIPADLDLILYGSGGVRLFEQRAEQGQRRWVDRTADSKLPPLARVRWLLCCDMDHDGNLDLVVGLANDVRILRNRGAWAFEDVTGRSTGLEKIETLAATFGDFDRDGDLDFLLLTKDGSIQHLDNRRGGRFVLGATGVQVILALCLATFDANADGRLDVLIGTSTGAVVLLADATGLPRPDAHRLEIASGRAFRAGVFDYDNDGWPDVWLIAEDAGRGELRLRLFRNQQGVRFEDASSILPAEQGPTNAVAVSDLDVDGDLDLLTVSPRGQVSGLGNDGGNKNHWLRLRLQAELNVDAAGSGQAVKSNYRCVGGTAELRSGRHYQFQVVTETVTHFGLGQRKQVELVRVIWTNGVPQAAVRPKIDAVLVENQRPKGSCPYLFTWDGERFVFVTDCLWSSGLGMKQTHGVDMPHERQHNYLVIPGDKLKPRNDRYVLQFTNELWEGPFLDQAQLWVVDHPADVEIFTNQRVPPDSKEEFKLLTVKQRRHPRAARDQQGRDVLSVLNQRDGRCLGGFRRSRYVGLAEPHWLELDLGDLSMAKTATLYVTGWIWPTDTSGNVAISQDPRFAGPTGVIGGAQPPALLVPDGKGGWATANPMMGFQSGKLQTVAVPLPLDKFPPGDYRVRIATMMELYWDEVFLTVDEATAEHELKRLPVAEADLHYRGYSRILQAAPTSPHLYDYHDVDPTPQWLPLPGKFVRYGPVTELLQEPDSRYVVMSTGDEVTLEFKELPPPKPGWNRSFIFYANGWLKDFDLNASAGDAIGPYPFEAMTRYPYVSPEQYPSTGVYERFLKEYLTRTVNSREFWEMLHPPGVAPVPTK